MRKQMDNYQIPAWASAFLLPILGGMFWFFNGRIKDVKTDFDEKFAAYSESAEERTREITILSERSKVLINMVKDVKEELKEHMQHEEEYSRRSEEENRRAHDETKELVQSLAQQITRMETILSTMPRRATDQ